MLTSIIKILCLFVAVAMLAGCFGSSPVKNTSTGATVNNGSNTISPEARQDYEAALEAMKRGDVGKAKALLKSLVQAYPELSGPHTNLGLLYFREQKVDEAEASFVKAIEVNPNSSVSYNHLGIINRGKGNFTEAENYYLKALDINDDYALAHLNLGILYDLYLGKLKQAKEHYERFLKITSDEDKEVKQWLVDLDRRIRAKN